VKPTSSVKRYGDVSNCKGGLEEHLGQKTPFLKLLRNPINR